MLAQTPDEIEYLREMINLVKALPNKNSIDLSKISYLTRLYMSTFVIKRVKYVVYPLF